MTNMNDIPSHSAATSSSQPGDFAEEANSSPFMAYSNLPVPVYILDQWLQCIHANEAACDFLGKPEASLTGQGITVLFPCNDISQIKADDIQAFESPPPQKGPSTEVSLVIQGKQKFVRFIRQIADDASGNPCLIVILQDASNEIHATARIHSLENAISVSREGIAILNQQYRFEFVNQALCKAYGIERSKLIGRSLGEMVGTDTLQTQLQPRLNRCLAGEHIHFSIWMHLLDKGQRLMDISYTPMRDLETGQRKVIASCKDITPQENTPSIEGLTPPASVQEEGAVLFDSLHKARLRITPEGRVSSFTQEALALLGTTAEKIKEADFIHDFSLHTGMFKVFLQRFLATGETVVEAIPLRRGDGEIVTCLCSLRATEAGQCELCIETPHIALPEGGNTDHALLERKVLLRTSELTRTNKLLLKNIHEFERSKRELLEYRTRMRRLALELSMAEQRERCRLALELHDGISQDLALARISLSSLRQNLAEAGQADKCDELLELIKKMIGQSRGLIWEMGAPDLYDTTFEAALGELAEEFQSRYGIETSCETLCASPLDLNQELQIMLFQMARELLVNAIKHANATSVVITLDQDEQNIRIKVEDNGKGMPHSSLQPSISKESGFGLSSIRERLDLIGGALQILPPKTSGACIVLVTPRLSSMQAESAE